MPMLDTIFVRKQFRRNGYGKQMIQDFINSHNGENIGISEPISDGLLKGTCIVAKSHIEIVKTWYHSTCSRTFHWVVKKKK